ncbi:hypothetical protein HDU76_007509, partial [Blyttiomyces sp. JEL0837]
MLVNLISLLTFGSIGVVLADATAPATFTGPDGDIYSQILIQLDSKNALVVPKETPAGGPLQLNYQTSNSTNKYWRLSPTTGIDDDNTYTFVNAETGWCADAKDGMTDFSVVTLNPCSGSHSQIWTLKEVSGDVYNIVNIQSNRCLNDFYRKQTPGSAVGLYQCVNGDPANSWAINSLAIGQFWNYISAPKNNQVLDFPITSTGVSPPGTQLQLYHAHQHDAQYFRFIPTGDGTTYNVVNKITNYCLEVLNGATANYSPVGLNVCNGNDIQKWSIGRTGSYATSIPAQVVSLSSGKCLNVYYAQFVDHNPIIIFDCNGADEANIWTISYNTIPNKLLVNADNTPVLSNAEITVLLWGNGVPNADMYPEFYTTYNCVLMQSQYVSVGQYGINRGSYKGTKQLPPPGAPALPSTKEEIKDYLHQLVAGGFLTPNKNTYYAIHFAENIGFTCKEIKSCAYHSSVWIGDIAGQQVKQLPFGVIADM